MSAIDDLIDKYRARLGEEIDVGSWLTIEQDRIDRFAGVTGDEQWIHTDPERARVESPFGETIAHGFLTLSLLPKLTGSNSPEYFREHYPGMNRRLNYGLNKVRFPAPVRSGRRVRARTRVKDVSRAGEGMEIVYTFTIEIENEDKPACVAEQVFRLLP